MRLLNEFSNMDVCLPLKSVFCWIPMSFNFLGSIPLGGRFPWHELIQSLAMFFSDLKHWTQRR